MSVTKGQFSMNPSDSGTESDGGKSIGNVNEFPGVFSHVEVDQAVIEEVNMLRGDVTQRAASELVRVAREVLGGGFQKKSDGEGGIEYGVVVLGGKKWKAARVRGQVMVLEQRFREGDVLSRGGEKEDVVVEVKRERFGRDGVWRYVFKTRGWSRDISSDGKEFLKKVGSGDVEKARGEYGEALKRHEEHREERRTRDGERLREKVDSGWLAKGMRVKWNNGKGYMDEGEVVDFNFETGRVRVKSDGVLGLGSKLVWVKWAWVVRER